MRIFVMVVCHACSCAIACIVWSRECVGRVRMHDFVGCVVCVFVYGGVMLFLCSTCVWCVVRVRVRVRKTAWG